MEFSLWLWLYGGITGTLYVVFRFCWKLIRPAAPRRAPAPELNDRWKCQHPKLIEVDESATGEIVAYICEKCDAQVDITDQAAVDHRKVEAVANGWADLTGKLNEDKADMQAKIFAARTQLAEIEAGSPYVKVMPDLSNFKGRIPPKKESLKGKRAPKGSWY